MVSLLSVASHTSLRDPTRDPTRITGNQSWSQTGVIDRYTPESSDAAVCAPGPWSVTPAEAAPHEEGRMPALFGGRCRGERLVAMAINSSDNLEDWDTSRLSASAFDAICISCLPSTAGLFVCRAPGFEARLLFDHTLCCSSSEMTAGGWKGRMGR